MADETVPEIPAEPAPHRQPVWALILKWLAIAIGVLAALVVALIVGLNTGPGKRFIAGQLAGYTTASGINIHVGEIEGSIYSHMILHDLEVRDPKGTFLRSPAIDIHWHPFAYLHSKIDLDSVTAGEVTMLRNPALKPTPVDPNAPTIPDIDLTMGRLRVDRFILEPPVTGQRHIIKLDGSAAIADGRAQLTTAADALVAPGVAGGDTLRLKLDALPAQNRLMVDVKLNAPAGGVVDSYAKLGKPVSLTIGGKGDWSLWQGRLDGTLGGQAIAGLDLTGRNGTFHAVGNLMLGIMLTGPAQRLTEPAIHVDATTTLDKRKAQTQITLASDMFTAQAQGLLDFAASRFGNFQVAARLTKPGSIMPNLSGRNVVASAALDGAFGTPSIAYKIGADAISFGATGVEGLSAAGTATINTNKILVPLHMTAKRVTGLNAAAGGLVTNIAVDGDIAYSNSQVFGDNLRLRSDKINATAIVLADLKTGKYTGALKGRVNDYNVNGLGRINLVTDAHLVTGPSGGFGIKGHVRVETRKVTNASLAQQLGGPAVVTADVGYDPKAGATVSNLKMNAPDLRILSGEGGYNLANGAIRFRAEAWSRTYGPANVVASGTIANPVVVLKAAHPGVGIGLANLEATLTGSVEGYRVRAKAGSNYGPFTADVLIKAGKGPLAIGVNQFVMAGITVHGNIVQTAAGPFGGILYVAGSGLNGQVALAAAGKNQKADINLTANQARLPGPGGAPISIGSGLVRASVTMLPNGPAASGSVALVDLREGTLLIRTARTRFTYANGRGQAALTAAGTSGVPFDIAAQADITPQRILANLKGSANNIPFHLAQPMVATKQGTDYVLQPATLVLPQGSIDLSGRYGKTIEGHAKLNSMDLAIVEAFMPNLGIGGKANGTLDLSMAGGAVPNVRARVDILGFNRTGALVVSDPVDIALLGTLNTGGGDLRALIRRNGSNVGRVAAHVGPFPGGSMSSVMHAPISGGVRYNGPAEVLWTLTGIGGQTLAGPIAVGADFAGTPTAPRLTGVVRANQLRYENTTTGTTLTSIAIDGRFTQNQFMLNSLTAKAGPGSLSASGSVGIDPQGGFPIDVKATLTHAQLAHSDALGATVSGNIAVTNSKAAGGLIKGDLRIENARYQIVAQGAADVVDLTGVRRKGTPPPSAAQAGPAPTNWKLDIRVRAQNQLFVQGMGLDSEWSTDMRVGGTTGIPTVVGRLQIVRGSFSFNGRRLDLEDQSTVTFTGAMLNPDLNIRADTNAQGVTATIVIGGTGSNPMITFTSSPALPQDEVLSRLLFGASVTSLTPTEALQLAAALNSLRPGSGKGLNPLGKLRSGTGLDSLQMMSSNSATGQTSTGVGAGKYISRNIYVQVIADTKGFTQTQLTIALSKALSLISQAGSVTGPSMQLRYSKTYK